VAFLTAEVAIKWLFEAHPEVGKILRWLESGLYWGKTGGFSRNYCGNTECKRFKAFLGRFSLTHRVCPKKEFKITRRCRLQAFFLGGFSYLAISEEPGKPEFWRSWPEFFGKYPEFCEKANWVFCTYKTFEVSLFYVWFFAAFLDSPGHISLYIGSRETWVLGHFWSEFWRNPEFLLTLSFVENAQKKSLHIPIIILMNSWPWCYDADYASYGHEGSHHLDCVDGLLPLQHGVAELSIDVYSTLCQYLATLKLHLSFPHHFRLWCQPHRFQVISTRVLKHFSISAATFA